MATPKPADIAGIDSAVCAPIGDVIARRIVSGNTVFIYLPSSFDLTAFGDPPLSTALTSVKSKGGHSLLVLSDQSFGTLDDASRAGLRDASHRHGFAIATGETPLGSNGAPMIAAIKSADIFTGFYCRETEAAVPGPRWGTGGDAAIVEASVATAPRVTAVPSDELERKPMGGSRVRFLERDPGRPLAQFGQLLVGNILRPELEAAGLWKPGKLASLSYSDRYLKAPLPAVLALRTLAALRDALSGKLVRIPLALNTELLREDRNASQPRYLGQNWLDEVDRAETIKALAALLNFDCRYVDDVAPHGRKLNLTYSDGTGAILLFDQGFGYWRTRTNDHHNFRALPSTQAKGLLDSRAFVVGHGDSYIATTAL